MPAIGHAALPLNRLVFGLFFPDISPKTNLLAYCVPDGSNNLLASLAIPKANQDLALTGIYRLGLTYPLVCRTTPAAFEPVDLFELLDSLIIRTVPGGRFKRMGNSSAPFSLTGPVNSINVICNFR